VNEIPETLSVSEAAKAVGVSRSQMYALIDAKKVPATRYFGPTRVLKSGLANVLERELKRPRNRNGMHQAKGGRFTKRNER
jgi:excisionase family DNA binding protein